MSAPYDRDNGPGVPGPGHVPPPPPSPGQRPEADPYLQGTYGSDPFRQQEQGGAWTDTDPLGPAPSGSGHGDPFAHLYRDRRAGAEQPPPVPDYPEVLDTPLPPDDTARGLQPEPEPVAPAGPVGRQSAGGHSSSEPAPGAAPTAASAPAAAPAPAAAAAPGKSGGRAGGILKSSALMAAGSLVSRITGFVRTVVITAAIGVSILGDSYAVAYNLPTMLYILVAGGALNSVFVPQLVRSMKEDDDGGEGFANSLLTLVMVLLGALTVAAVVGAPLLVAVMSPEFASKPDTLRVTVALARYCLPVIFFMGLHVVMGQILNARGRFGAMMWTPVLNNIVIIATFGMFIFVYGTHSETNMGVTTIPDEGLRLLGVGTMLGLVVQALAMLPYLRASGFRFRPRFDWRGRGLGKSVSLAKWTFLFVLANQAGLIVVTQLATAAGAAATDQGFQGTGFAAYNNALLIWQLPQAVITVSVMTAVLPRISRAANDGDPGAVRDDLSYGLRTSGVAIVPAAFAFLALGPQITSLIYGGGTDVQASRSIGHMLMAFGLGLIPYSIQYVVLRGFYAYEDTRTPFYNTVIVAAVNAAASAACYFLLPARWAVVGMAGAYGLAYAVGVGVAVKRLGKRLGGDMDGPRIVRTYTRLCGAALPAALLAGAAGYGINRVLGEDFLGSLVSVLVGGALLLGTFVVLARRMRIEEVNGMVGMVRGRLGR
ncbi:murein biosynthesis integral membrane protein MurJ [Streptomyces thermolineatus]|uniref:Murein biosynthesis integral membrane protein MurJ n=1 Tax=Streptomyces thermolineatus TaxID=44033 RepID=A0ABN3L2D6_9ACTN